MRLVNKARLRNTLKKLAAIDLGPDDGHDHATAAQEALDFLAMMAGLKPVLMLGRGFTNTQWIKGTLQIAVDHKLHVVEGPYWDAAPKPADLPEWYVEHTRAAFEGFRAHYVCKARVIADEVAEMCRTGTSTVADEARLLGYPACCVEAHHARSRDYQIAWLSILEREADSEETEMRRLLADGAPLMPATDDERSRLEAAMKVHAAPFTSVNMCEACAASSDSAARRLSRRNGEFARALDQGLARELATASAMARAT